MMGRVEVDRRFHWAGSASGFLLGQLTGRHRRRRREMIENRGERVGTSDHRLNVEECADGLSDRPKA